MESVSYALYLTAISVAFLHTVLGPDHYLPFIVLSKARGWSAAKTYWITILCGVGHVLSSIVLGLIGIFFGVAIQKLTSIEAYRGDIASWLIIIFGLGYFIWGIIHSRKKAAHHHLLNVNGHHIHNEDLESGNINITPWVLFIIFVLGPCEPLIPLFIYPAAHGSMLDVVMVTGIFSIITISTMLGLVIAGRKGLELISFKKLQQYMHAVAGMVIFLCGISIQFLGL
ncbi:MAG: hypothetical protein Kow00108_17820 [Calditrichia bacterium]